MKKILFSLLSLSFLISSCSKDDDDDNQTCELNATNLAGTYRLTSFTANGVDVSTVYFDDCERDDLVTLNANGTYVYEDAGTECNPSGDDNGTWSISGNTFIIDYIPFDLTVNSFDCRTISGSNSSTGATLTATFTKQ